MSLLAPHRSIRNLAADWRHRVFGVDPEGATPEWAAQLRTALARPAVSRPTDVPTAVIPPIRRPIAAITAQPHGTVVDQLGPWQPHLHPLQPAVLAGETR